MICSPGGATVRTRPTRLTVALSGLKNLDMIDCVAVTNLPGIKPGRFVFVRSDQGVSSAFVGALDAFAWADELLFSSARRR
ncbi:hypothetical protein Sinac_3976 [Singulisphaera acidiphila DSM 18658]|uniref:Uncharacterized protein n=1 Tax=Singulisphaera acidiphila (strain ATCC BAA-1392 / DSM 18658 / VKM B-2454 / MOB10) TaxID=886293 RepID=L0DHN6_SINAD|nr:hypothetical protein Sinac_3976 [Singulisphaera acidiphila DSM 18658]